MKSLVAQSQCALAFSLVLPHLDPTSLVLFGATDKHHYYVLVNQEVARRRKVVLEYEERVRECMGNKTERPRYTRTNVTKALELKNKAYATVASATEHVLLQDPSMIHHPFRAELDKFVAPEPLLDEAGLYQVDADPQPSSPLAMLPFCFYCPKVGEPMNNISEEARNRMTSLCQIVYLDERSLKDNSPVPQPVELQIKAHTEWVADVCATAPALLEAFRDAARRVVLHDKRAQDVMENILVSVEEREAATVPAVNGDEQEDD